MAQKVKDAYTKLVNDIFQENDRRLNERFYGKHDQFTGEGIEGHTIKCRISDYSIPNQWLNKETGNDKFYMKVMKAGSIEKYITKHKDEDYESVSDKLLVIRLVTDPAFAFYVCFSIKYKTGGRGPFILNYAQRVLLAMLEEMRLSGVPIRIVLLKARQWGGSTLTQLYMAWIQLFVREQWNSVIIAQTKDTAKRIKAMFVKTLSDIPGIIFGQSQLAFSPYEKATADSIITDLKGNVVRDNVVTTASYENFESTRGMDYAMAHFSEVAYWRTTLGKSAEEVVTNILSNVLNIPDTIVVEESTAKGNAGLFYDTYQLAKAGKSMFKSLFIPFFYIENDMLLFKDKADAEQFIRWLLINAEQKTAPDVSSESGEYLYGLWLKGATLEHIKWYIEQRKAYTDHAQIASEAPSDDVECFKFSGNKVFSAKVIDDQEQRYKKNPILKGDIRWNNGNPFINELDNEGRLWIWKHPDKILTKHRYLVVVDVGGRSINSDYNVITVIDRLPTLFGGKPEVVARWRGHIRYDYLADKAISIATYYDNALLAFESNTFDKKKAESNEFVEQGDHIRGILNVAYDKYQNLYMRKATDPEDIKAGIMTKIGFQTNKKTKQDMVDRFIVEFESDRWIDHDERFYQEIKIYEQREDGSYGNIAGRNNHDDILMTDMIGSLVMQDMEPIQITKNIDPEPDYDDDSRFVLKTESDF